MQAELFAKCFESKGYERISAGCYGQVFARDDSEWIIKKARNDGTRTFLEWCVLKCNRGERMRGMPTIDFVIGLGGSGRHEEYLVAMQRYTVLGPRLRDEFEFELTYSVHNDPKCPAYIVELVKAFERDCPAVSVSDLHYHNIMEDQRTGDFVITDPSSSDYRPVGSTHRSECWDCSPDPIPPNVADVAKFELV